MLHLFDPYRAKEAADLQQRCPTWLIMWRPWARCFTAFYAGDSRTGCAIDAPTTRELHHQMAVAELELWRANGAPPHRAPTPTRPRGQARQAQPRGPGAAYAPHRGGAGRPPGPRAPHQPPPLEGGKA